MVSDRLKAYYSLLVKAVGVFLSTPLETRELKCPVSITTDYNPSLWIAVENNSLYLEMMKV